MTLRHDEDIVLAKLGLIDEALGRIGRVVESRGELQPWIVDDLYALYLQRAVEACIDLANHLIAENRWTTPSTASEAFRTLNEHGVVDDAFASTLIAMVGFRNVAVHSYDSLDLDVVRAIVDEHLDDLRRFSRRIVAVTIDS